MTTLEKVYRVLSAEHGKYEEVRPEQPERISEALAPYPRDARGRITVDEENMVMQESNPAGPLTTTNFPDLLRAGLQFDAWTTYAETPVTYPLYAHMMDSNKPQEEYLFDVPFGTLPVVEEGAPYPEVAAAIGEGKTIKNRKYGMIVSVTEEMQKFDQIGKVRELGELMGRSARRGEEQKVMDALTTLANYTRTSTAGDNDEATGNGANQQNLTFSAANLIIAFNLLRTMKEPQTGVYYNVRPNTLMVTPKLWWAAQQLLRSPESMRVGGSTTEVYGTGTINTFFDAVDTIIVSPEFGASNTAFAWSLFERRRGLMFQRVEPVQVLIEGKNPSTKGYFERDVLRYRVRNWFGVGLIRDQYHFYSPSNTAPAVS